MKTIDFSSWQGLMSTLLTLALVTLIGVGVRLLAMFTLQQRRERANRQINERLRVLIAAYKTLGGSFTGDLAVDPPHLRDVRRRSQAVAAGRDKEEAEDDELGSERARRMRDAVEAALSDIMLLGTEGQVRLAGRAARELVAGHQVHTHELVVSLRNFIREALDLDPVPADLEIPVQGPTRPAGSGGSHPKGRAGEVGEGGAAGGRRGGGDGGRMVIGGGLAGLGSGHPAADEDEAASSTHS